MSASRQPGPGTRVELAVELLVVAACVATVLAFMPPWLLNTITTTTGGDTGSHTYTAWYTAHYLLPQGKVMGWVQGNLAGYPLFQFYFPLPFFLMALLGKLMPLVVAFKWVSAAGAFLLPVGAWAGMRLARAPFPAPALAAACMLPFLFNEHQTMWGGNIASLMAGEMGESLGLIVLMVYFGSLARDLEERRRMVLNGCLLALAGFMHGITLMFGVLAGGVLLIHRDLVGRAAYLFKVYAVAFCLMGLWIVPMLLLKPWTTLHNKLWHILKWQAPFPPLLLPLFALALLHGLWALWGRGGGRADRPAAGFFLGLTVLAGLLYLVGYQINVVDIRFIPLAWLALIFWAVWGLGSWLKGLQARALVPLIGLFLALVWVDAQVGFTPAWIRWNYNGFERTVGWGDFKRLADYLEGGLSDPRVLHEHADRLQEVGTTRVFENLPLFSGRNTMEGLYIQSSINTPFVFYLQSLTTITRTEPLPDYDYTRWDLERAVPRMILYNVGQFVTTTPKLVDLAEAHPGLVREAAFGPYAVWRVKDNPGTYAVPLKYKPVLVITHRWRRLAYQWFRFGDLEVPLVFKERLEPGDQGRHAAVWHDELKTAPRVPLPPTRIVSEEMGMESLRFKVEGPGPVLVKVSYHPCWTARGATAPLLASPAFMLVYPEGDEVVLTWERSWRDGLGWALTGAALLLVLLSLPGVRATRLSRRARGLLWAPVDWCAARLEALLARPLAWAARHGLGVSLVLLGLALGLAALWLGLDMRIDAGVAYHRAKDALDAGEAARAERLLDQAWRRWPHSPYSDLFGQRLAEARYRLGRPGQALATLDRLLAEYPDTRQIPELLYRQGVYRRAAGDPDGAAQSYQATIARFPATIWAGKAAEELKELGR